MTRTGPYFSPRRELGPQPRPPRTVGGTASASEPPRRRQGSGGRGRRRPGPARRRCQCQAASAAAARPGPGHCPRTPGRHRLRPVPGGNLGKQNSTKFSAGGPLQPTTKTHYQLVPATNVSKRAVVLTIKKKAPHRLPLETGRGRPLVHWQQRAGGCTARNPRVARSTSGRAGVTHRPTRLASLRDCLCHSRRDVCGRRQWQVPIRDRPAQTRPRARLHAHAGSTVFTPRVKLRVCGWCVLQTLAFALSHGGRS